MKTVKWGMIFVGDLRVKYIRTVLINNFYLMVRICCLSFLFKTINVIVAYFHFMITKMRSKGKWERDELQ